MHCKNTKYMLTHINLSVTIKVLPFFKPTPDTWFAHLKAQFDVKNITTSSTKFYWCIAALPSDVSAKLTHVRSETLEKIKDCLIHLYSLYVIIRNLKHWSTCLSPVTPHPLSSWDPCWTFTPKSSNQISFSLVYSYTVYPGPSKTIS